MGGENFHGKKKHCSRVAFRQQGYGFRYDLQLCYEEKVAVLGEVSVRGFPSQCEHFTSKICQVLKVKPLTFSISQTRLSPTPRIYKSFYSLKVTSKNLSDESHLLSVLSLSLSSFIFQTPIRHLVLFCGGCWCWVVRGIYL